MGQKQGHTDAGRNRESKARCHALCKDHIKSDKYKGKNTKDQTVATFRLWPL